MLGYAIEQVTNLSYEQAIADTLFEPLEMKSSTYAQPLPPEIDENLALGYGYNDATGGYDLVPHDFVRMSPGVALVTNGADMGNYMRVLLNGGWLDGNRIFCMRPQLSPATKGNHLFVFMAKYPWPFLVVIPICVPCIGSEPNDERKVLHTKKLRALVGLLETEHDVASELRSGIHGLGDDVRHFVIGQTGNDGCHQGSDRYPGVGQLLDGFQAGGRRRGAGFHHES